MQPISIFPPDTIGMASKFIDDLLDRPALGSEMPDDALKELERDGLTKAFPEYAAQVALYQAYLDVTNPALFTALNADTCERLSKLKAADDRDTFGWSLIPVTRPYLVETLSQTKLQRPISLAKARRRSGRLAGHRAQRPAEGGL